MRVGSALGILLLAGGVSGARAVPVESRPVPAPSAPLPPPSPCDPEPRTWCETAGAGCSDLAGTGATTDCAVREADRFSFNEGAYCSGCTYVFYVLVECGREMHLPLADMEGARITVTEVLSGRPATLRCLNDAAKGNPPEVLRCVGPGGRTGYGPPFDRTVATGDALSWGFPDCVNGTDLTCDDIPAGGGTVDRVSPGELQTMDCFVSAPNGLCGLYRVEIDSGGFEWQLFANCDGSATPQFRIFHDCSEALAAFEPRPELAVASVAASGNCPALEVSFLVQNLGCVDWTGTVPVRISSDCVPPQVVDVDVAGPIPANGAVSVIVPMNVPCDGNVTVTVDPANVIGECTESAGVASCDQASGVRAVPVAVDCCAAVLDARAEAGDGCAGENVTLDGSASTVASCARPLYRWLDGSGVVVRDWSPDPVATVPACPGGDHVLELACEGETCVKRAVASVGCTAGTPPGEATDLVAGRRGAQLDLDWTAAPGAEAHRVLRGTIAAIFGAGAYDHAADPAAGAGACSVAGTSFTDPDDGAFGTGSWYYLVVGWNACGGDGTPGTGRAGASRPVRPPRLPTASCP